jgi:hypothetical protein
MIDLENQHREEIGERPLVDMDLEPRLDDVPRREPPVAASLGQRPEWVGDPNDNPLTSPLRKQRFSRALPIQPLHFSPTHRPQTPAPDPDPPRARWSIRSWMVIVAILIAAAMAGVIVAMSGPDVSVQRGK